MSEKTITTPHSLKNDFRDVVRDPYAGISEAELVTRDQVVLLKELRFREESVEADRKHFEVSITRSKIFRMVLLALPKSPYRELVMKDIGEQVTAMEDKHEKMRLPKSLTLSLLALEELFAETEETVAIAAELHKKDGPLINLHPSDKATVDDDAEAEDEFTISIEQAGESVDEDGTPTLGEEAV